MTRWQSFKAEFKAIGVWFVESLVWIRDQFTFLRAEHIRSLAALYVMWQGERAWRAIPAGSSVMDPQFIITVGSLILIGGLAWQATSAKVKVAGMQLQLGATPDAADRTFANRSSGPGVGPGEQA